jgi:hypothetical protein
MLAAGTLFLAARSVPVASAQTITVTTTLEAPGAAGDCTLGEAIQAASGNAQVDACPGGTGSDLILLAPGATYTLTQPAVPGDSSAYGIHNTITIRGDGATLARQPDAASFRFFTITVSGRLSLIDLTLRNGRAAGATGRASFDPLQPGFPGGDGQAGAIFVDTGGELTLEGVTFSGNQALGGTGGAGFIGANSQGGPGGAADGGALYNLGLVLLSGSGASFIGNTAIGGNGGAGGTLYATGGRSGHALGGAIFSMGELQAASAPLVVADNEARAGNGGNGGTGGLPASGAGGGWFGNAGPSPVFVGAVFSNNRAQGGNPGSGAIFTDAMVGGEATGGGLYVYGDLALLDSRIISNTAAGGGGDTGGAAQAGGLYHLGSLTLRRTLVAGNTAAGGSGSAASRLGGSAIGGGLVQEQSVWLDRAAVVGNTALGGSNPATTTLAIARGGGIALFGSLGAFTNTTIALNTARNAGALWTGLNSLVLTHVTVVSNTSAATAGLEAPAGASVTLRNSMVAYNAGGNCTGTIVAEGANIQFPDATCGAASVTDPLLGPVGDYGGQTLTAPLLPASPALNSALAQFCPPSDQRGRPRPSGAACDLGAYEYWAELFLPFLSR